MNRTLEPELMDDEAQALAYARADFSDSNNAFVRHFGEIAGPDFAGCILDLGCGPGDIARRLARAHPRATVHAVDGAHAMLHLARQLEAESPESVRVTFLWGMVPDLVLPRTAYDAVVSNSLLHHLSEPGALWTTIRRYAAPGAPVVIMDLVRPISPAAADALVETYAEGEAEILRRDFLASLHAAFEPGEIEAQLLASGLSALAPRVVSDRHVLVAGRMPARP